MARPKNSRNYCCEANSNIFKPQGIPISDLEVFTLDHDEYEAIKHCYLERLSQAKTAQLLGVSQPTLHRILANGLNKIAKFLVGVGALEVQPHTKSSLQQ